MDNEIVHNYEGYIWYSDKNTPEIIENKNNINEYLNSEHNNPFIIEGQIYDSKNQESYSLKYVNGNLLVKKFNTKETTEGESTYTREREFVSHRMQNRTLHFIEVWREEKDDLCEKMRSVYKPHELIFTGFNKVEP